MHRLLCSFLTGVLLSQTVTLAADQLVGGVGGKESLSVRGAQAYSPSQIASELWTDHAVLMASRPTMPLAQYLSTRQARTLERYRHAGFLKAEATVELRRDRQEIVMQMKEGPCFLARNVTISGAGEKMQRGILKRVTNPADDRDSAEVHPVEWA